MINRADTLRGVGNTRMRKRVSDFLATSKPRVVLMALTAILVGFWMGARGSLNFWILFQTLLAMSMATAGTLALNQYLEREVDARMERTRSRPLPDGRLKAGEVLVFGLLMTTAGLVYVTFAVNGLAGLLTAVIVVTYLVFYTPLKMKTEFCNLPGAVAGALPPLVGWAAAAGTLPLEAWILFAIMFVWQFPHLLAIGWLYKEEYDRAGVHHIVSKDADPRSVGRQILVNCLALLVLSLMPTLLGLSGQIYFFAALAASLGFLACGISAALSLTILRAKVLLFGSLVYLPLLFFLMVLDRIAV